MASSAAASHRGYGIASATSYVLLFLLVGMPVWYKTTEVYRVSLPYQAIQDLKGGQDLKLRVELHLVSEDVREKHKWGPSLQPMLKGETGVV